MPFLAGRMQTSDIAYFLLLGGLNLALTLRQLERRRRGPGSETGAWRQEVPFHVLDTPDGIQRHLQLRNIVNFIHHSNERIRDLRKCFRGGEAGEGGHGFLRITHYVIRKA